MSGMKIAIVGHEGRMGRLLVSRLGAAGCEVAGVDRPLSPAVLRPALAGADVVLLCVPVEAMSEVLTLVGPLLATGQVLADITSVKALPMQMMEDAYHGPVVGTHPLFGPAPGEGPLPVAVVPGSEASEEAVRLVERLFQLMDCAPFRTTAAEHDRAAARIQGLNFISSVAYLATLAHDETLLPYVTPSFRRRLEAAHKMLTEDAAIFEGMFEANPYSQDAVRSFRSFLSFAAAGDVDVLLDRACWWWRDGHDRGGVRPR